MTIEKQPLEDVQYLLLKVVIFQQLLVCWGPTTPVSESWPQKNIFRRDTTRASDATLWPWISQRPEVQGPRRTSPRHRPPKGDRVDVSSNRIILGKTSFFLVLKRKAGTGRVIMLQFGGFVLVNL